MKMDTSAKKTSAEITPTEDGVYSQEQLDDMLEDFIRVKNIEADPTLLGLLRDYAKSKNKMVDGMFSEETSEKTEKPKSVADLKKIKSKMDAPATKKAPVEDTEED